MILAVLQARMSSTRMPGKVMAPVLGEPMIWRQIERMRRARTLSKIVVATSTAASAHLVPRPTTHSTSSASEPNNDQHSRPVYQLCCRQHKYAILRRRSDRVLCKRDRDIILRHMGLLQGCEMDTLS